MNRVDAIYTRQSIERKDSISIETQIELCRRQCDANAVVYRDAGFSGKNTNRPEFTRLMRDVRDGKIKRVFCYRLDRISRSIVDFGLIWQTLEKHGAEFCSVTEQFDTSTPMGRAMVNIIIVFAQLERETIAERVKTSYYARTAAGTWCGGRPPFGFRTIRAEVNGKIAAILEVNPEEAEIVKEMFDMYETGSYSLCKIASILNAQGKKISRGKGLGTNVEVRNILVNPVCAVADVELYSYYFSQGTRITSDITQFDGSHGPLLIGKRQGEDRAKVRGISERVLSIAHHQGFIPSAQFIAVQDILSHNKQVKNDMPSQVSWANGLLRCANCGHSVQIYMRKQRNNHRYAKCNGRYKLHNCDMLFRIRPDEIEEKIELAIQGYLDAMTESSGKPQADSEEVTQLKIRRAEVEQQMNNLVEAIAQGGGIAMRQLSARLEALETELNELSASLSKSQTKRIHAAMTYMPSLENADMETKRQIARMIVKKAYISVDDVRVETIDLV